MTDNASNVKWSNNVILVDADYVDKVAFDLIVNFERMIAAKSVPSEASVACSTAIALEWDAAFKGMNDPSGRAVKGVHEQAY